MKDSRISRISVDEFNPREYVTHYASERDIIIWKQVFDAFDTDEDGILAPRDLLEAMSKHNGYHPKRNYIYKIISMFDKDESGNIDFRQFLRMVNQRPYEKDTTQDFKRVFNEIDQTKKGYLTVQDLRSLTLELKEELSEEEIRVIMNKLDPKKTGKISYEAFVEFNTQIIL